MPTWAPHIVRFGEEEKARESYDQALRLNAGQANAYLGLGQLLEKQNKLDEAIGSYSRSVELRPTDRGFLLLGHALERWDVDRGDGGLSAGAETISRHGRSATGGGCAGSDAALAKTRNSTAPKSSWLHDLLLFG